MKFDINDGAISIIDFDAIEAFKIACKIESDGIEFYSALAQKTVNPDAKVLFMKLKTEEERHLEFFVKKLEQARSKAQESFEEDDLISYMDYGIFNDTKQAEILAVSGGDLKRALDYAINNEKVTVSFYNECWMEISSFEGASALKEIIKEEERHIDILKGLMQ